MYYPENLVKLVKKLIKCNYTEEELDKILINIEQMQSKDQIDDQEEIIEHIRNINQFKAIEKYKQLPLE